MEEKPARKSHAWAWAISVVAVPVLYFLSLGPLNYYNSIQRFEKGYFDAGWQEDYWAPANWLVEKMSLSELFDSYLNWWYRLSASHYLASHPSRKPAP